jgi:uncharacterized damage-inducible protein DinB
VNDDLRLFYQWVRASRERVFAWAETLPAEAYTLERPDFAYGSLRNIHAHVVDCYLLWIGHRGLGMEQYRDPDGAPSIPDVAAMRAAFRQVDEVLEKAFDRFADLDSPVTVQLGEHAPLRVTRRWLVMHPITHEFHHKGQMLALGRVLGHPYPPGPDTDLAEPF